MDDSRDILGKSAFYYSEIMKSNLIVPVVFLVVFVACAVFGDNVIESGWSFLAGAVFALSVRDLGKELINRARRR